MIKRYLSESSSSQPIILLLVLPCLLLLAPPSALAASPALLSLLTPWAQERQVIPWRQAALEAFEEGPYSQDDRRLVKGAAFLSRAGDRGSPSEEDDEESGVDWESPREPDLFLLTELGAGKGMTSDKSNGEDEMAARRVKRTGLSVGGSRIRTSVGAGMLGGSGGRGGFGGLGASRGMGGGGIAGGPSLSIVNPLDVLRQRLLLEIARRRMRQSEDQILANRELLKSIGKREAVQHEADSSPQPSPPTKKTTPM